MTRRNLILGARCLLPTLLGILSGCSVNGVGFATAEVIRADGAIVIITKTYGAALRTAAADAGLAIGYTRTLAVIADTPDAPAVGLYPFGAAPPEPPATAIIRRVAGINFGVNRQMIGVACGVSEDAVLARMPAGSSIMRRLVLVPDDPVSTELHLCRETEPCPWQNL